MRKMLALVGLLGFVTAVEAAERVTPENYVRADVDLTFANIVREVGSNKFRHDRSLIPLDKQPAVTMNRDTIYSFGIFYAPKGTKITLPKSKDDRYQSAMILQQDHYIDQVFYGPGTFTIESQTPFAGIAIRTQVDATNPRSEKEAGVFFRDGLRSERDSRRPVMETSHDLGRDCRSRARWPCGLQSGHEPRRSDWPRFVGVVFAAR